MTAQIVVLSISRSRLERPCSSPAAHLEIEAEARACRRAIARKSVFLGQTTSRTSSSAVIPASLLGQADGHGQAAELVHELDLLGLAAGPDAAACRPR